MFSPLQRPTLFPYTTLFRSVVMGWGFDDDRLLVPDSVTSPDQLAGKSVGVLVGSSEDYELLGYLALQHLTGKVRSEEHTSELQSPVHLVCRLLLEKKNTHTQ